MSEFKCVERAAFASAPGRTSKPNKPFCSLAYLAKSTVAINGPGDVRIVANGHNGSGGGNCQQPGTPHLAATAKVNDERGSPALPTGAATPLNGAAPSDVPPSDASTRTSDIFGVINEEAPQPAPDQVDSASVNADAHRPWELGGQNGYVRRVPPALVTQNGYGNGQSALTSLSKLNSLDCWDYTMELECLKGPQDLQLAAELGKTLLERNKELETQVKDLKGIIDEQKQEITYLKKHTNALREVNDTRLKVYEQLDLGIQELERANHRLMVENTSDKKHIKSLVQNVETLEARQDELTKQLDETRQLLSMERRKNERLTQDKQSGAGNEVCGVDGVRLRPTAEPFSSNGNESGGEAGYDAATTAPENCSFAFRSTTSRCNNANSTSLSSGQTDNSLALSDLVCSTEDNEEIIKLVNDLEMTKKAFLAEQQRCTELEEQLVAIIQENQTLQSRIAHTSPNEEMKSMQEELSILDEVRQGKMCSRCLRVIDDRCPLNDEQSSLAPTEECDEDEERSLLDMDGGALVKDNASDSSQAAYRSSVSIKVSSRLPNSLELCAPGSPNPYRDLVEKYEALLEVQCSSLVRKSNNNNNSNNNNSGTGGGGGMSLAEELQSSGEFSSMTKLPMLPAADATMETTQRPAHDADNSGAVGAAEGVVNVNGCKSAAGVKSGRGRTPTDFSEAETSSSGYVEETICKATQTDDRPGSFLCTIGDGEVCKFSIYDDASPIESHFRNRPEYRELFKEIFAVLKKAAANKEEGEKLPLLDDTQPAAAAAIVGPGAPVPPVTPANEELPVDFGDDTQSIISSAVSEQSFAMSECITKLERKTAKKHIIEKNQENQPPLLGSSISTLVASTTSQLVENGRVLTPLKREPLEYLSVGVGIKKKNRKKNRNFSSDRCESPATLPSPPRFFVSSGKKRRDVRPYVQSPMAAASASTSTPDAQGARARGPKYEWNGSSMIIYNRGVNSPSRSSGRGRELDLSGVEYRPSTLSQDLHLLKKLDLSYAEVLRRTDGCKQLYPEHEHEPNHSHSHSHSHSHNHSHSPQQQQQRKQKQLQQRQRRTPH